MKKAVSELGVVFGRAVVVEDDDDGSGSGVQKFAGSFFGA